MGKKAISIILIIAIIFVVNLLSRSFSLRFDTTEDNQYTLSGATHDILKELEDPVTVTAYFSEDLHPSLEKAKGDFRDILEEYSALSGGLVNYEIITPNTDELKQDASSNGIQPFMINIREKDQNKQQRVFMGAVLKSGEQNPELMPLIQQGMNMEYDLSTKIKKMSVIDKPAIGMISGHGEAGPESLSQAYQGLSILYAIENIDLANTPQIPERFKTIAMVQPMDSIPLQHFQVLDDYLNKGGNLFIAMNAVTANLQTSKGMPLTTGVEGWLKAKGLEVEHSFAIDSRCGNVTVQQRVGPFMMPSQVPFPYLPMINNFDEHPITEGLEMIMLPFASPMRYLGDDNFTFTPLLRTSAQSGIETAPLTFDAVSRDLTSYNFGLANLVLGGVLEGGLPNATPSKIVIIGDADFALTQGEQRQAEDNISLMVNSIDWLSDDTGLVELRTKGVSTRPLDQLEDGKRQFLKILNIGLPLILIMIFGFIRSQRTRAKRAKLMAETY